MLFLLYLAYVAFMAVSRPVMAWLAGLWRQSRWGSNLSAQLILDACQKVGLPSWHLCQCDSWLRLSFSLVAARRCCCGEESSRGPCAAPASHSCLLRRRTGATRPLSPTPPWGLRRRGL